MSALNAGAPSGIILLTLRTLMVAVMKITEEIAVLSVSGSGYTKEINLVSWNGAEPKFDIRSWSPGREKCGKGIALTQAEAKNLFLALQKVLSE